MNLNMLLKKAIGLYYPIFMIDLVLEFEIFLKDIFMKG